jgi:hypothetical protein
MMAKTTKKPAPTSKGAARKTRTPPPTNGAVPAVSIATAQPITDADIAARAYEIYLSRGAHHGRDLEDWLEAESSLRSDGA